MKTPMYWIAGEYPGRLAVSARPRGDDWLADEAVAWKSAGVNVVVSLLEADEALELGLAREADECRAAGMEYWSFPLADRSAPESFESMHGLAERVAERLRRNENVVIHCRQGIGRSAVVVVAVLLSLGARLDTATAVVSKARGVSVPETDEQRRWLNDFAKRMPRPVGEPAA